MPGLGAWMRSNLTTQGWERRHTQHEAIVT
jgi:hypothetical protein